MSVPLSSFFLGDGVLKYTGNVLAKPHHQLCPVAVYLTTSISYADSNAKVDLDRAFPQKKSRYKQKTTVKIAKTRYFHYIYYNN